MLSLIWVWSDGTQPHNWKLFKGSRPQVLSQVIVIYNIALYTLRLIDFRVAVWSLKYESIWPAIVYACRGNNCYILNVKDLYRTIPSQSTHPDMTPVVWSVQKQPLCSTLGNSQHCPAPRRVSAAAGDRDFSEGVSTVATTIHGQNSTPPSWLNDSGVASITQHMTSNLSATQWRSMSTPTAMTNTNSHSTCAPGGPSQRDSTCRVVSSFPSGIASTPTPFSYLDNLPTPIPNAEACLTISNPLQMWATKTNQRQR